MKGRESSLYKVINKIEKRVRVGKITEIAEQKETGREFIVTQTTDPFRGEKCVGTKNVSFPLS